MAVYLYYIVRGEGGREHYRANDGEPAFPLSAAEAEALARADFTGEAGSVSVRLIERDPSGVFKRALPVWRVEMGNPGATNIYVDALTGEITARRNRLWRWYDFMWMLDIMDYGELAPNSKHRALVTPAKRGKGNKPERIDEEQEKAPSERRAATTGFLLLQNRHTCHPWQ